MSILNKIKTLGCCIRNGNRLSTLYNMFNEYFNWEKNNQRYIKKQEETLKNLDEFKLKDYFC